MMWNSLRPVLFVQGGEIVVIQDAVEPERRYLDLIHLAHGTSNGGDIHEVVMEHEVARLESVSHDA